LRRPKLRLPPLKLDPFPHLVISSFIEESNLRPLVEALARLEYRLDETDLYSYLTTGDLMDNEEAMLRMLRQVLSDGEWLGRVATLFETGHLELQELCARIYSPTDYYLPHTDAGGGRNIAFVLCLAQGLTEERGGCLDLFECDEAGRPEEITRTLVLPFNSLALLQVSEGSWYQLREVLGQQKVLMVGGWYGG